MPTFSYASAILKLENIIANKSVSNGKIHAAYTAKQILALIALIVLYRESKIFNGHGRWWFFCHFRISIVKF